MTSTPSRQSSSEEESEDRLSAAFAAAANDRYRAIMRSRRRLPRRRRGTIGGFERRLRHRWGAALDLFELALVLMLDSGAAFNKHHRPTAVAENDLMFDVLARTHARACVTCSEVLALSRIRGTARY